MSCWIRTIVVTALVLAAGVGAGAALRAQELGGAGTVQGAVTDPTGGVMKAVAVDLVSPVSGFKRSTTTDATGRFAFRNVPPNAYHVQIVTKGFAPFDKAIDVRSAVPLELTLTLALAVSTAQADVVGRASDLVELNPVAHTDVDQSLVSRLPIEAASGLNQAITLAAPGVVADSNGFFHPIGDHAQTQFSIDNQPVTDQQSRVYSNQISPAAVQSMEVITGVPPAEFGDKDSLVVRIVTKSGLDTKPSGSFSASAASFMSPGAEFNFGAGSRAVGNFVSLSGLRTDRFLDPPEFAALHDHGTSTSVFDRLDARLTPTGTFHLNLQAAQSAFQVPNSYDQDAAGQDQRQKISTFNVAPGYSTILGSRAVLTANAFGRQDRVTYTPSADPFADTPATLSQTRRLTNVGLKVDLAYLNGRQSLKMGGTVSATALTEHFALGITDPAFNAPCLDADGRASTSASLTSVDQCAAASLAPNDAFVPGLLAYDLSRGGGLFAFNGQGTIKQQAAYLQDEITTGALTINLGLRMDHYDGLTSATLLQPRAGVAYLFKATGTIARASYGRTMETPYNENLLVSSTTGASGLADAVFGAQDEQPLQPGKRNQFEAGLQQGFGHWLVLDVGYFRKTTRNAYDFDILFDTPVVFPISWAKSEISGVTGRVNLVEHRGFSAFTVFGHNKALFFNPENGGILFDSPLPTGAFRIDHDQKFQQTTNLQYQFNKKRGVWAVLTWRYDSGLVAGSVPDFATALTLSADQQAAIGLFCGDTVATRASAITACDSPTRGALRVRLPADGTEDDATNPPRIAPRHLLDLGMGIDNLFGGTRQKVKLQFSVINLANTVALYNFLSTFSGTHFVTPRAYRVQIGVTF